MVFTVFRPLLVTLSLGLMTNAIAHDFEEGQVWSYRTRAGEETSRLLIDKVETDPKLGEIFHISLSSVFVKNKRAPSGMTTDLPHFPVSRQTLESSVIALVGHAPPNPGFAAGYAEWKRAKGAYLPFQSLKLSTSSKRRSIDSDLWKWNRPIVSEMR